MRRHPGLLRGRSVMQVPFSYLEQQFADVDAYLAVRALVQR
jgi:hypothetical protein